MNDTLEAVQGMVEACDEQIIELQCKIDDLTARIRVLHLGGSPK